MDDTVTVRRGDLTEIMSSAEWEQQQKDARLGRLIRNMPRGTRLCRHTDVPIMHPGEWWCAGISKVQVDSFVLPEEALLNAGAIE